MRLQRFIAIAGVLLLVAGLALALPVMAQDDAPEPSGEATYLQEYYDAWITSPHADATSGSFTRWDADGVIPERCAACHSTIGYLDYIGADGSEVNVVNAPAPIGTTVTCDACHNPVAASLTAVTFPSGITVENLDDSTRCMVCHSGRSSTVQVNNAIETAGLTETPDTISPELTFINIHYYAAAATLYGSEAKGGYEYEGKSYELRYDHVEGYQTCSDCHEPHTLELKIEECQVCHEADDIDEVREIRMFGSMIDYDGDGDIEESLLEEIETLQEMLFEGIQTYASEVAGTPIGYDKESHPYFFIDTDGDGEVSEEEANRDNAYNAFSPTLLRATYNYQVSLKDPGSYAHNAKYHIELLYDSIEALNTALAEPIDLSQANRDDPGHFNTTSDSFRHWDEDGMVPGSCAKCHTAEGLPVFLENNTNIAIPPSNSMACITCHDSLTEFTVYTVNEVTMPSGAVVSFGEEDENNICLNCHQGRESNTSISRAIAAAGAEPNEISPALRFRNPHYFAAGATLFGAEAQGAYQFEGKEYSGRFEHVRRVNTCTDCHNTHSLVIDIETCSNCHESENEEELVNIRLEPDDDIDPIDYDGDGNVEEGIYFEIDTMEQMLFDYIMTYAAETIGTPMVYDPVAYPYFFVDTDADGEADPEEIAFPNQYPSWTPTFLEAVYNYLYVSKDPGGYAHNPDYTLQILYDSIEVIGGEDAVAGLTRAPVMTEE